MNVGVIFFICKAIPPPSQLLKDMRTPTTTKLEMRNTSLQKPFAFNLLWPTMRIFHKSLMRSSDKKIILLLSLNGCFLLSAKHSHTSLLMHKALATYYRRKVYPPSISLTPPKRNNSSAKTLNWRQDNWKWSVSITILLRPAKEGFSARRYEIIIMRTRTGIYLSTDVLCFNSSLLAKVSVNCFGAMKCGWW